LSTIAQRFTLTDLLTRAGAHIRGRRANCPKCKRQRTVSIDETRGLYHCHGAGCDFSGGAAKLARELGLARQLTGAEYREFRENQERADRAARALYEQVRARRFRVSEWVRTSGWLEVWAHERGPGNSAAWDVLEMVYRDRPALLAELAILENCGAADLLRFLSADNETRERVIKVVIERGGLYDRAGRFVDLTT